LLSRLEVCFLRVTKAEEEKKGAGDLRVGMCRRMALSASSPRGCGLAISIWSLYFFLLDCEVSQSWKQDLK